MLKDFACAIFLTLGFSTAALGQNSLVPGSSHDVSATMRRYFTASEAERAMARLGDLSLPAVRERLSRMRQPAYQPGPVLLRKISEQQEMPIVSGHRLDQLKAILQPVLAYHERYGKLPIIVLRSEHPRACLAARAAIIITTGLVMITSETELRGIIAHELAHEYVWEERKQAAANNDERSMREYELFCDAVAAITLKEIGEDPAAYARALKRMTDLGTLGGSATRHESATHPALDVRLKVNQFLCRWLGPQQPLP